METKELITLAESMAGRYKNSHWFQDLTQEGLVKALEAKSRGVTDENKLRGVIRKAQSNYRNILSLPVSVPPSGQATELRGRILRGLTTEEDKCSDLYYALMGKATELDDTSLGATSDHASEYEAQEFLQAVLLLAAEVLSDELYEVFDLTYNKGLTQKDVAEELLLSRQTVKTRMDLSIEAVQGHISGLM